MERTFAAFCEQVRESLEPQAHRKGYSDGGADGEQPLYDEGIELGDEPAHGWGEIRLKIREWFHEPRSVLLLKVAGWAFLTWRETPRFRECRGLPPEQAAPKRHEPAGCVR
jgi:hypothetical protein